MGHTLKKATHPASRGHVGVRKGHRNPTETPTVSLTPPVTLPPPPPRPPPRPSAPLVNGSESGCCSHSSSPEPEPNNGLVARAVSKSWKTPAKQAQRQGTRGVHASDWVALRAQSTRQRHAMTTHGTAGSANALPRRPSRLDAHAQHTKDTLHSRPDKLLPPSTSSTRCTRTHTVTLTHQLAVVVQVHPNAHVVKVP